MNNMGQYMVKISLIEKMILNKEEKKELLRLYNPLKSFSLSILERKKKYRLSLRKLNSIAFVMHSILLSAVAVSFYGSPKTEKYPEKIFKYSSYGIYTLAGLYLLVSSGRKVGANHILYQNYKHKMSQLNSSHERV